MSLLGRMDLAMGCVPDYRTFVRHVWSYEEPGVGSCITEPPWIYSCIFEDDKEAKVARRVIRQVVAREKIVNRRIQARRMAEGDDSMWEVRFRDLEALHLFLVHIAAVAVSDLDTRQIGEFLMWTLGFRWV